VPVVTVLVGFGLVWLWLRANASAMEWNDYEARQQANPVRNFDAVRQIQLPLRMPLRRRAHRSRESFPPAGGFGSARRRAVVTIRVAKIGEEQARPSRQILYKRDY
jgi:hypothetical protein